MDFLRQIQHPSNVITDYLLAVVVFALAFRLLRKPAPSVDAHSDVRLVPASITRGRPKSSAPSRLARWWGVFFVLIAVAAVTGGTFHGLETLAAGWLLTILWKVTVLAIGAGSAIFAAVSIELAVQRRAIRRALLALVAIQFFSYASWMLWHDDFRYVVYQYGASAILVLIVFAASWKRHPELSRPIIAAIVVTAGGALVQQYQVALHHHFDHNDLYHVIQMLAMLLLYRAGARFGSD
jgi:hypothetical protein